MKTRGYTGKEAVIQKPAWHRRPRHALYEDRGLSRQAQAELSFDKYEAEGLKGNQKTHSPFGAKNCFEEPL